METRRPGELDALAEEIRENGRAMRSHLADLLAWSLETRLRFNPAAAAPPWLRKVRSISISDLVDVTELMEGRILPRREAWELAWIDLLLAGVEGKGEAAVDAYVVCEVSSSIDEIEVLRARERADILRGLGFNAHAAVAGYSIREGATASAASLGVEVFLRE